MASTMNRRLLQRENDRYAGSGGTSPENRSHGFRPAFRDTLTDTVYPSCFADGQPAPFHLLDGLPEALVMRRSACGRILAVRDSVISGFLFQGRFFTRDEAAFQLNCLA